MPPQFKCPICGAALTDIQVTSWTKEDDGTWVASNIDFDCVMEPDIDDDAWPAWFHGHYATPYVDWLPLEMRVNDWMKQTYRFAVEVVE